eukprot:525415-Pleurochrysis_carterae.AAC.4
MRALIYSIRNREKRSAEDQARFALVPQLSLRGVLVRGSTRQAALVPSSKDDQLGRCAEMESRTERTEETAHRDYGHSVRESMMRHICETTGRRKRVGRPGRHEIGRKCGWGDGQWSYKQPQRSKEKTSSNACQLTFARDDDAKLEKSLLTLSHGSVLQIPLAVVVTIQEKLR